MTGCKEALSHGVSNTPHDQQRLVPPLVASRHHVDMPISTVHTCTGEMRVRQHSMRGCASWHAAWQISAHAHIRIGWYRRWYHRSAHHGHPIDCAATHACGVSLLTVVDVHVVTWHSSHPTSTYIWPDLHRLEDRRWPMYMYV